MQRIASALSTAPAAEDAALEAVRDVEAALGGAEPDLAYLFLSPSHLAEVEIAAALVRERLRPARLLGCVAEGVVGGRRELESGAGLSLWAGALPGARVDTFHLEAVPAEEGVAVAGVPDFDDPALVTMLVDPFTFPAGGFLRLLNEEHEGLPLVGGIAAGAGAPGSQVLIVDDATHASGVVGATVSDVPVRTIVSQGCAPIGRDAVVTRAEENVVFELAGEPALERLKADLGSLPRAPRRRRGLGRDRRWRRSPRRADDSLPRAGRRLGGRGPTGVTGGRPCRRDGRRSAPLHLQRSRDAHVLGAGPRRSGGLRRGRLLRARRLLLRGRDRPGRRPRVPARVHRHRRRLPHRLAAARSLV